MNEYDEYTGHKNDSLTPVYETVEDSKIEEVISLLRDFVHRFPIRQPVTVASTRLVPVTVGIGTSPIKLNVPGQVRITLTNYDTSVTVFLSDTVTEQLGYELRAGMSVTLDTSAPLYVSAPSSVVVGVIYESVES